MGRENTSETSQTQTLTQNSVVFLKHSYKKQMLGELDSYLSSTVDELQQEWLIILLPGVISSHLKWGESLEGELNDGGFYGQHLMGNIHVLEIRCCILSKSQYMFKISAI